MNTIGGRVILKESGVGIPDLPVVLNGGNSAAAPAPAPVINPPVTNPPGPLIPSRLAPRANNEHAARAYGAKQRRHDGGGANLAMLGGWSAQRPTPGVMRECRGLTAPGSSCSAEHPLCQGEDP
jgi:hypothetical protein